MEIIATGRRENSVIIWDMQTGDKIASLGEDDHAIVNVFFSPCGSYLFTISVDGTIISWDCQSWTKFQSLSGHPEEIVKANIDREGTRIVTVSEDGVVRVRSVFLPGDEVVLLTSGLISGLKAAMACFDATGDRIAVAFDERIDLFDSHSGLQQEMSLAGHQGIIRTMQFSPDGRMLVSGSHDRKVIIWDISSGGILQVLFGHTKSIANVCFDADSSKVLTCSSDNTVRLWVASSGECLWGDYAHRGGVPCCCFSEDGTKAISTGGFDGEIKVWDIAHTTGRLLREMVDVETRRGFTSVSYRPSVSGSFI